MSVLSSHLPRLCNLTQNSNASRLEWWVSKDNADAQHFYKKIGAEALGNWNIYKGSKA